MTMQNGTRVFLALTFSDGMKERLFALGERLREADVEAAWEPSDKLHITVRFLGSLLPEAIEQVSQEMQFITSTIHPFDIIFTRLGAFPHPNSARILWAGAHRSDRLIGLMKNVEQSCRRTGCEPDPRAPHPHATLARIKRWHSNTNLTALLKSVTFDPIITRASELTLMKSVLHQKGSTYSTLMSFPFNRTRSLHD